MSWCSDGATSGRPSACCALVVAGKAGDLRAGVVLARAAIDEGRARTVLDRLIAMTNSENSGAAA
jgi:anthranilate phosphoribosyltransferase